MNSHVVVVHGATGTQGAAVVRRLRAKGYRVRAVARKPSQPSEEVEAVAADLLDVESLVDAYLGADAVVVHLPLVFGADTAVPQAEAVLTALRKAGVRRAVFNTSGTVTREPVGVPFVDARVLLATNLAATVEVATVVTPAMTYMENLAAPWSTPLIRAGRVVYPLPADLAVGWVAMDDVAATIADVVVAAAPPALQIVSGPQSLTGLQMAAELSTTLRREMQWETVQPAEYEEMLAAHLGREIAAGIAAGYTVPPSGPQPAPDSDPSTIRTGVTSLATWAAGQEWR